MSYFTTGLETLTEKVAIAMPANRKIPLGGGLKKQVMPPGPGRLRKGLKRVAIGTGIGLGVAGLGTGWALKKEHERDRDRRGLAYAPMSGI